jgi:hypothetical protein
LAAATGHWGEATPGLGDIQSAWLRGDVNFDGVVDGGDFGVMQANMVVSQMMPLGVLDMTPPSPVPEAGTGLTVFAGAVLLMWRRNPVRRLRRRTQDGNQTREGTKTKVSRGRSDRSRRTVGRPASRS